jgi:membrane associated rhomboid family serine protease
MFPLKDDNPTRRFPVLTVLLILINALAFRLEFVLPPADRENLMRAFGLVPAAFPGPGGLGFAALFTSQFLHGGVLHLGGNMLYLWIFGNNVEDYVGRLLFIPFYLACGAAAGATQILVHPHSLVPTIGASGAIAGVLGAYFVLFPRARVHTLVFLGLFIRMVRVPAGLWLALWFVIQILFALVTARTEGGTAWFAHAGGFAAGALFILLSRPRITRERRWTAFSGRSWLGLEP